MEDQNNPRKKNTTGMPTEMVAARICKRIKILVNTFPLSTFSIPKKLGSQLSKFHWREIHL